MKPIVQIRNTALDCGPDQEPIMIDRLDIERGAFMPVVADHGGALDGFLNLVALRDRPESGSYRFDGAELCEMGHAARERIRREKIGELFLDDALNKNVAGYHSAPGSIAYMRYTIVSHQKLKYALGCLYADYPELIVVGKPTGLLDSEQRDNLFDCLRELNARGATVLIAADDPEQIAAPGGYITLSREAVFTS